MSETECNTGKLIPVSLLEGETNEQYAFNLLGGKKDEYNKTYLDQLLDDGYREWYLYKGVLYRVENDRDVDSGDIFQATRNADGSINYVLQYYNGGCSFTEAMDNALSTLPELEALLKGEKQKDTIGLDIRAKISAELKEKLNPINSESTYSWGQIIDALFNPTKHK